MKIFFLTKSKQKTLLGNENSHVYMNIFSLLDDKKV